MKSITIRRRPQATKLATCVFPPTPSCTRLLESDAEIGAHEKNDENIFAVPYKNELYA